MVKITPSRSHTRTYIHQDDQALMALRPTAYRVLRYMANRADARGVCWPGAALIADDLAVHRQTIYEAWSDLESVGALVCQRESIHDPLTGRMIAKVWQVSPYYICVADDWLEEAREMWKDACGYDRKLSWSIKSQKDTNQQQNQQQEPTPRTNKRTNNNIHQVESVETAASAPQASTAQREHSHTHELPIEVQNWPQPQQRSTDAAGKNRGSAKIKKYNDPQPVESALSEPGHEQLASNINTLGIPLALSRGFVTHYGYDLCNLAWQRVSNTTAARPGGLFRYLVQRKLVAVGDVPPVRASRSQDDDFNDFIQS